MNIYTPKICLPPNILYQHPSQAIQRIQTASKKLIAHLSFRRISLKYKTIELY